VPPTGPVADAGWVGIGGAVGVAPSGDHPVFGTDGGIGVDGGGGDDTGLVEGGGGGGEVTAAGRAAITGAGR
jgi:hypothetical protein